MTPPPETQIDLFAWACELGEERERVAHANAERATRRGDLVFATDPNIPPEESGYREVYATEAKTPNQARAKSEGDHRWAAPQGLSSHRALPARAG